MTILSFTLCPWSPSHSSFGCARSRSHSCPRTTTSFSRASARYALLYHQSRYPVSFATPQILALFVALPPFVSVLELVPRCGRWFWDLSWVRLISFRPQHSRRGSLDRNDIFDLTGEPTLGIRRTETAGSDATKWGGDDPYAGHNDYHKGAHGYATVNMKDSDL
jgi:hypothetical protein